MDHFEGIRADVSVKCEDSQAVWFSKLEADGKERDGVALFWNRRVLTLSSGGAHCFRLGRGMSQIAVVGVFEHLAQGKKVLVAGTHLKAKEGFEALRETQAKNLCEHLKNLRAQDPHVSAVVVLGDFNDTPDSPCALTMRAQGFRSAYSHPVGAFTTSKWRNSVQTRVIDYIWHSAELSPSSVMEMPNVKLLEPTHLPIIDWPSDHLLIAAILSFQTNPNYVQLSKD